jgi:hypothetical protein
MNTQKQQAKRLALTIHLVDSVVVWRGAGVCEVEIERRLLERLSPEETSMCLLGAEGAT